MRKSDFLSLRFLNGGLFSSAGSWRHSTRIIDNFELIVVTKGTIHMQQNGIEYTLSAGDYLLLLPEILHGGTSTSDMPVEFYWLHFVEDEKEGIDMPPGFMNLTRSSKLRNIGAVIQSVRQLLHCSEEASYPSKVCDHITYVLFAELIFQTTNDTFQNSLAVQVHEYIRSHTHQLTSANNVAEYFGYNIDYLSRILKKNFGRTLQQDIVNERLNRAKLLLQTSDYTVSRIAMELGYEDANLFVKFFRYHLKVSPTEYRKSFTKLHTNHI